jgi:alpha-tubulin suppressor-like RCC1 family protein
MRTAPFGSLIAFCLSLILATSCTTRDLPLQATPNTPRLDIQDAAHAGGNAHFFFLPPMVPVPSYSATTDPTQSPVVIVCQWVTSGSNSACGTIVAFFSMAAGTGSEVVRYDTSSQAYIVNWHTDQCLTGACTLDPTLSYRLRVLVGSLELGHADVIVVSNGSQLQNVQTGQNVGLVDGRTLPVQFRIERGAVAVVAPGSATLIGASGGNIVTSDGHVALAVPAGALAAPTNLTLATASSFPAGTGAWSAPVDLGPSGTTFAAPVIITLSYDPTQLPPGVPPSALGVYVSDGTGWEFVSGSTVNAVDNTVSVPISHFSTYTVTIAPTVVNGVPSPTTISVGQATTLSGYVLSYQVVPSKYCYYVYSGPFARPRLVCVTYTNTYSYPAPNQVVLWTALPTGTTAISLASNRTYTDQAGATGSPPITGLNPGTAQIVASLFVASGSLGRVVQSNPVTITVVAAVSGTYRGPLTLSLPIPTQPFYIETLLLAQSGSSVTGTWLIQDPLSGVVIVSGGTGTFSGTINGAVLAFTGTQDGPCGGTFAGSFTIANGGGTLSGSSTGSNCLGPNSASVLLNRTVSVASVIVTPATATVAPGGTVQLTATTKDATGSVLAGRAVIWASGTTAVATVSAGGLVTGIAAGGPVTITATSEGKSGTAAITVASITFAAVTTGGAHNCGLTVGGTVFCWGHNSTGELGNNATLDSPVPVSVAGGLIYSSVSPGRNGLTCSVTTAGAGYCWGHNNGGQLGNGSTTDSPVPVPVAGGLTLSALSSGFDHTCGLTLAGATYCWGFGGFGQLGNGTTTFSHVPAAVVGGLTFSSLSSGATHNCALTAGGAAYCWGFNGNGELGNNSTTDSPVPVAVAGGLTFSSIGMGDYHACGVTTTGAAYCWGWNMFGQLGNGATTGPQQCSSPNFGGPAPCSTAPVAVGGGLTFSSLSGGFDHTCGLTPAGAAYCWGRNNTGALGTGTFADSYFPGAVVGGLAFRSLSTGGDSSCGLTTGGLIYCWGGNYVGQLGNGSTINSAVPVKVAEQL